MTLKEKKWGQGNNLKVQDKKAIFHENVKQQNMYYFYVQLFSDFENHNKWAKLILHLPKKHHWVYTTHSENNTKLVISNWFFHVMINNFLIFQVSR